MINVVQLFTERSSRFVDKKHLRVDLNNTSFLELKSIFCSNIELGPMVSENQHTWHYY